MGAVGFPGFSPRTSRWRKHLPGEEEEDGSTSLSCCRSPGRQDEVAPSASTQGCPHGYGQHLGCLQPVLVPVVLPIPGGTWGTGDKALEGQEALQEDLA